MFPTPQDPPVRPQPLVLWIIWFALLSGMGMILFVVGGGWPEAVETDTSSSEPLFWVGFGAVLASAAVRLLVLPKVRQPQALVSAAVIGMALAESALIFGAFVLPDTAVTAKKALYMLAFLGVLAYLPTYARRLAPD